ncbi:histidine phosphatase family protein [soil metagenome]
MPAALLHLVRHGEVYNPTGVLYGRIPGFHLSELGHRMAQSAASAFVGRDIRHLYASPLQRAQESAAPWHERFALPIVTDERIIEPTNKFEGSKVRFPQLLGQPHVWPWLVNPLRPSWGEAYTSIAARVDAAMHDAWNAADGGEVVMVSHQLPIWMATRKAQGKPLFHDARKRRCSLSSITSFTVRDGRFVETAYEDPTAGLLAEAKDLGAV